MKKSTNKFTLSALFAAAAAALLYISSVVPTASIAVAALAGLFCAAAVIECGTAYGLMCWAVASTIALLLAADKATAFMFALCLGLYPVVKRPIERMPNIKVQWLVKLGFCNAVCAAVFAAFKLAFVTVKLSEKIPLALVWIVCNVIFVIYDIGLTKLVSYYIIRISSRLRNKKER